MSAPIVAIINPKSGNGRTLQRWERVRKYLPEDLEILHTNAPEHAIRLTAEALKHGAREVIAVGGDGTINEVINGFFVGDRSISPDAALGIIPMGTGSDLRRTLKLPLDEKEAAFVIRNGIHRAIDLMRVRYTTHDRRPATRYAVNVVSFGLGGIVAARRGRWPFLIATAWTALSYSGDSVTITLDGKQPIEAHVTHVAIGNGQFHGNGMWVCPRAEPDDGLLDVTLIESLSAAEIAMKVAMLYNGRILEHPKVQSFRATKVQAQSTQPTLIEVDGEPLGQLPMQMNVVPRAIRIIC